MCVTQARLDSLIEFFGDTIGCSAGWHMVVVAGIWILDVICEGLSIADEILHVSSWDGEIETFTSQNPHVRDADDLSTRVEQWTTGIAGIDGRVRLDERQALEIPLLGRDDSVAGGLLEAERVADREDGLAHDDPLP